ncbi:hypothetical protein [Streptomyces sp. V4I2]|uniref:hypothetical protein n=1 Tax=Streptomyces sp. V4I2 TaxID=3042280 RepID=UPI0027D91BFF|nr:hypothetical protein [Streptomyces sp. V4I2]
MVGRDRLVVLGRPRCGHFGCGRRFVDDDGGFGGSVRRRCLLTPRGGVRVRCGCLFDRREGVFPYLAGQYPAGARVRSRPFSQRATKRVATALP